MSWECLGREKSRFSTAGAADDKEKTMAKRMARRKKDELTGWDSRRVGDRRFRPSGIGRWHR